MEIIDQLRMSQTKRYGICHTHRHQSVAEHSFGVLLITMHLTDGLRDRELAEEANKYAILHDAEEVYTGDIPSSFKRVLRQHAPNIGVILDGHKSTIDEVAAIVKLADYLEAIYYLREYGGSRLATGPILADILSNFRKYVTACAAPEECIARAIQLETML